MISKTYSVYIYFLLITFLLTACGPQLDGKTGIIPSPSQDPTIQIVPINTEPTQTNTLVPSEALPPSATPTQMIKAERIPIIEYHNPTYNDSDTIMMTTEWFEFQMQWLSENGYKTLNSAELVDFLNGGAYPQKSVILSFDIGVGKHTEYSQIVIPALRKYGFTAIVFLIVNTNLIGDECNKGELFCWSELRAWSDEGLISVESHGIYHKNYTTLDTASQKHDAGESKRLIEENIGKPVLGFAYPYDAVSTQSFNILKSLGYQFAAGGYTRSERSVILGDTNRYNLPRVYPYSNNKVYPLLSAMNNLTFEQMILAQTKLIGLPTLTATMPVGITSTPTIINQPINSTETITATPNTVGVTSPAEYISMCNIINKTADPALRIYQLDHLVFPLDIDPETQANLPAPVILKPSCNVRPVNQPRAIILHFTRGPLDAAFSTFQKDDNTSAHYIIDRDGKVYQAVPESLGAFHVSCYGLRSNCVTSCPICEGPDGLFVEPAIQSIGIELVNQGQVLFDSFKGPIYEDYSMSFNYRFWEDYPETQIKSLVLLVNDIRSRWDIPLDMVMGHYRINTNSDPGPALNLFWDRYGNPPRSAIFPSP